MELTSKGKYLLLDKHTVGKPRKTIKIHIKKDWIEEPFKGIHFKESRSICSLCGAEYIMSSGYRANKRICINCENYAIIHSCVNCGKDYSKSGKVGLCFVCSGKYDELNKEIDTLGDELDNRNKELKMHEESLNSLGRIRDFKYLYIYNQIIQLKNNISPLVEQLNGLKDQLSSMQRKLDENKL